MGPWSEDETVTAAEKSSSYPLFVIAGIRIVPKPATSESADPVHPL